MTKITWLGHASWLIETADHCILLDPFLSTIQRQPLNLKTFRVAHTFLSHMDISTISLMLRPSLRKPGTVISGFEIAEWPEKHPIKETVGMNIGEKFLYPSVASK